MLESLLFSTLSDLRWGLENEVDASLRRNLLTRLYGILAPGGAVEVYLRQSGEFYVVKRQFNPITQGQSVGLVVQGCVDAPIVYRYDFVQDNLEPVHAFSFPIEIYEQHRISRLRDDVVRQLEMLDEFAGINPLKQQRAATIQLLNESANILAPLYDECEQLRSAVGNLSELEQELAAKQELIPGDEEQAWANTTTAIQSLDAVMDEVVQVIALIPDPKIKRLKRTIDLEKLFAQSLPPVVAATVLHQELISQIREAVRVMLDKIESARASILDAVQSLNATVLALRADWTEKAKTHDREVAAKLRTAGVESPQEVIDRVAALRTRINDIKSVQQPRLLLVSTLIAQHEASRANHLAQLQRYDEKITSKRREKAA